VSDRPFPRVKALVFDVFGTVVDWRGTVLGELADLQRRKGLSFDAVAFAEEWRREGYSAAIARIRDQGETWADVDTLHRRKLDDLVVKHRVTGLTEEETDHLNRVWHRLRPWPDAVDGLTRLKRRFVVSPLSNGNFALLTNMAKAGGLPWDCIMSAELFGAYKPDPRTYHGAARLLGLELREVMMVAAHGADLKAARAEGLATAFVSRPLEWGPDRAPEPPPDPAPDVLARDFGDLAGQLGL
jgi:2-haloacid dehalogenase